MDALPIALAALVALALGVVAVLLTRSRMEGRLRQAEQSLAEATLLLESERQRSGDREKAIAESARRTAMDEFLADVHVEERHYIRQHRLLFAQRRSLVMQERVFFRNVPLSQWVEHEVPLEEGANPDDVAKTFGVFNNLLELDAPRDERPRKLRFG